MTFYLGTHLPNWLKDSSIDFPLFVSARRLRNRKSAIVARMPWALDSGGFSELMLYGRWKTSPIQYAMEVLEWNRSIGKMNWAAIQDWMCEPIMIEKTGLSVREHQARTINSYFDLRNLAPSIEWTPVIQGYRISEYWSHVRQYEDNGIDLRKLKIVGLGSICRRQSTGGILQMDAPP